MAFKINATTIVDGAATIDFNYIVNKPSVMATVSSLHANAIVYNAATILSGSVLTI